jgi:acyl-coenzyme A thioesterase PaaI-like protein
MNSTAKILQKFKKLPMGLWLFSKAICLKAPYFASIRPVFTLLESGQGEARICKRRSVQNHLGTVHAIAIANLCELVAGTTLEITIPNTHRWIPKSMKINYIAKATTDLYAKTKINIQNWPTAGSENILVEVFDDKNTLVVNAEIEMYISQKKV